MFPSRNSEKFKQDRKALDNTRMFQANIEKKQTLQKVYKKTKIKIT